MRDEISVLIVDDNIEFGDLLCEYMECQKDIKVMDIARDGLEALDKIQQLKPDLVVLDIIMPNLDGIGVLEKLREIHLEKRPIFIMLSAVGQDVFIQRAIQMGADYYIVKPFDIQILISRIRQLYKERFTTTLVPYKMVVTKPDISHDIHKQKEFQLEVEVTNLMHEVGIPPHMAGYQYLREAILLTIRNSKIFGSITKVLYPKVAERFSTSPQKVERAIRNAIESAWARGNTDSIDTMFGYTINYNRGKPTNSEFIAMMADKVRISHGLEEGNVE